ncbi:hypothetical protein [Calothrix sp. NIES-2098]
MTGTAKTASGLTCAPAYEVPDSGARHLSPEWEWLMKSPPMLTTNW